MQTVGLPRPLEKNTKIRQTLPFSFPFLVTQEGQDNVGSRQRGSSHLRPATLGLGGAGSVGMLHDGTHGRSLDSPADSFAVWASPLGEDEVRALH